MWKPGFDDVVDWLEWEIEQVAIVISVRCYCWRQRTLLIVVLKIR